jgi:hypothetical protein
MKLYIYENGSNEVVAIVEGPTNEACEREANDLICSDWETYGKTYSPAIGCNDGLVLTGGEAYYQASAHEEHRFNFYCNGKLRYDEGVIFAGSYAKAEAAAKEHAKTLLRLWGVQSVRIHDSEGGWPDQFVYAQEPGQVEAQGVR